MGRSVLITGCSDGGLGAALALAFHDHGDRVFATTRDPSKMKSLAERGIETLAMDVLDVESIQKCADEVSKRTGGALDVLLNNAGSGYSAPLMEASVDAMKRLFDLNVWGVIRTSQTFLPLLRAAATARGRALLVNNTSVASYVGLPFQGAYSSSKAAAGSMTEALRLELEPFGVRVVDLKTGTVASRFYQNTGARTPTTLAPNSIYAPAAAKINPYMSGAGITDDAVDADRWAAQVVRDLSKPRPRHQIWRGGSAWMIWVGTFLPLGLLDSMVKGMTGLDLLERKLREQAAPKTK
jgi:NAD(P)-dependent dehydrogenase (short-subunit alcohol dehydrogenase family)